MLYRSIEERAKMFNKIIILSYHPMLQLTKKFSTLSDIHYIVFSACQREMRTPLLVVR